jgi:tRNA dimethylallyltransferase
MHLCLMANGKVILIAGPTASGKSALALGLAERLGGTIINADSMQVYAEMRILTARPTAADEGRVRHRLYGHVPAREAYSVGRYVADAGCEIAYVQQAGGVAIVVGGTGLYFKALLEGLSPIPAVPLEIRSHWRAEARRLAPGALHALLAARDPLVAARLEPADLQRITRALEVLDATGLSLADWQRRPGQAVLSQYQTVRLLVQPERSLLHARCDARFKAMIVEGALDEARAMSELQLDPDQPAMRAIGLCPLLAHLRGETGLDGAIAQGQAETRQYVKRQATWARRNYSTWWTIESTDMERNVEAALAFIHS